MTVESIGKRRRIERTYPTTVERAWELWTTPEGIESWWGPDGFRVEVHSLDLRPEGILRYSMIADDEAMQAFMREQGMPISHLTTIRYTEIVPLHRLAYANVVDFVPGVEGYEVASVVEFEATSDGVRLVLTLDAMHDEEWTNRAIMGWESELGKLARLLAA